MSKATSLMINQEMVGWKEQMPRTVRLSTRHLAGTRTQGEDCWEIGVDLLDVYVYWGRPTIIERFFDGKMGCIFWRHSEHWLAR